MRYLMLGSVLISIIILFISLVFYFKIIKHLKLEVYSLNIKYHIVSGMYIFLIVFFIFAYIFILIYWKYNPEYNTIMHIIAKLLFFGSIFVGLSVWVIGQSISVILGVRLNELDSMTGLMTKRSFEIKTQKILDDGEGNYALVVIDMDNFKQINDSYGHAKGDNIILCLTKIIKKTLSQNDMVGRFGGDEFVILFNNLENSQIQSVMESIEQKIIIKQKEYGHNECSGISYGLAEFKGGSKEKYQTIFEIADRNLYSMKNSKNN